ncbi:MAG: hypothetical protein GX758_04360 [Tenericutes bacterium]|nr:hypothetical protein [Mycoplasmatota bacterium]
MKSRSQREYELMSSGLVDSIKSIYRGTNHNIPSEYFILIADYIDSISQFNGDDGLFIDPISLGKKLPSLLSSITNKPLNGIYGRTDEDRITMNSLNDYETNKLYFFHELTHAIQTYKDNDKEKCSFYDGHSGMFLTEGATQFTAELLYNKSRGSNMEYKNQSSVRGQSHHTTYSAFSQYQLNGNILMLLSTSLNIPFNQLLALGFRKDGREQLKSLYELFPGQENKFEEFMFDLEKIYALDKLVINGQLNEINKEPRNIIMEDGTSFSGNMTIQDELISKVQRNIAANFIANNDIEYIMQNYEMFSLSLTTPNLKNDFLNTINELSMISNNQDVSINI